MSNNKVYSCIQGLNMSISNFVHFCSTAASFWPVIFPHQQLIQISVEFKPRLPGLQFITSATQYQLFVVKYHEPLCSCFQFFLNRLNVPELKQMSPTKNISGLLQHVVLELDNEEHVEIVTEGCLQGRYASCYPVNSVKVVNGKTAQQQQQQITKPKEEYLPECWDPLYETLFLCLLFVSALKLV